MSYELDADRRGGKGEGRRRIDRRPALDVEAEADQGEVPADADRTGAEPTPQIGIDVGLVGEVEGGAILGRGERDLEPREHRGSRAGPRTHRRRPARTPESSRGLAGSRRAPSSSPRLRRPPQAT